MSQPISFPKAHSRVVLIDVLRLIATAQMVLGHTLDALLHDSYRQGPGFELWTYVRGLTSVAFLFASGGAFYVTTLVTQKDSTVLARRFQRALLLVSVGYLLHAPLPTWLALGRFDSEALASFVAVDILQTIGVTLAIVTALSALLSTGHVVFFSWMLGLIFLCVGPWTSKIQAAGSFRFALNYLTPTGGSLFPWIPWGGYLFLGLAMAAYVFHSSVRLQGCKLHVWRRFCSPAQTQDPPRRCAPRSPRTRDKTEPPPHMELAARLQTAKRFGWLTGLAFVLGVFLESGFITTHVELRQCGAWVLRLAWILLLSFGLSLLTLRLQRVGSLLEAVAKQTLTIYVLHVLALYGSLLSLKSLWGHSLSLSAALGVAVLLLLTSTAVALILPGLWATCRGFAHRPSTQ